MLKNAFFAAGLVIAAANATWVSAQEKAPVAPPRPTPPAVQQVSPPSLPSAEERARLEERRQQLLVDRARQMGMKTEELKGLSQQEQRAKMIEFFRKYREQHSQQLTNSHRPSFRTSSGLTPEKIKELTPEQREQRMREAMQNKVAELEKKQKEGTLTPQEQMQLRSITNAMQARIRQPRTTPPELPKSEAKPAGQPKPAR